MGYPLRDLLPAHAAYDPGADGALLDLYLNHVAAQGLTLYPAQEEALLALYDDHNVILNTPTGSGKSLVAEALHFHSLAKGRISYYTCPIKALVNEKFMALCRAFGPESVGLITGDATVNAKAKIICCTAEILSNMALAHGDKADVDDVIMDEFHYYSDRERGVAWQVPLLVLKKARFLLMSATLGDMSFFEKALTDLNHKKTTLVRSAERPVPLSYAYSESPLHETVQDLLRAGKAPVYLVCFTQRDAADEAQNLMSVELASKDERKEIAAHLAGVRFTSPYGKDIERLLRHGVGLHHAGLLPKYRVAVERLAQQGKLKVICGTDTLGVGINIPIRTVLFSKLCKFDGEKTTLLSVRDFRQIAGRAGRKGYDEVGYVVAQAPEHVIENLRMEHKAASDPKKLKKLVRKKPPEKGYVAWAKETFDKLSTAEPEPLVSRFAISHGMLLQVLSRPGDGCRDMRQLIRSCHDSQAMKQRHGKLAFKIFRALVDRQIIGFVSAGAAKKRLAINVNLQEDFSLSHELSLYLLDTVKLLDPYLESYALDILTLVESILENPELILRRQLDRLKGEKMAQMKMDGLDYEERIAELEKLEHPKPNREFIYQTFNEFTAKHPWLGQDNIRPKSIAREMYEGFMSFSEYVREYDLRRSEGLLLRYLSDVYRVLQHTVPATCKDEEMESIIFYFGGMIRQIDSSLLDEWERLKTPGFVPKQASEEIKPSSDDITANRREFRVSVRNEAFHIVKALGSNQCQLLAEVLKEADPATLFSETLLTETLKTYRSDHSGPLVDKAARGRDFFVVMPKDLGGEVWEIEQVLTDLEGHNDWLLRFKVDLEASRLAARPVLHLLYFGPVSAH